MPTAHADHPDLITAVDTLIRHAGTRHRVTTLWRQSGLRVEQFNAALDELDEGHTDWSRSGVIIHWPVPVTA